MILKPQTHRNGPWPQDTGFRVSELRIAYWVSGIDVTACRLDV